MSKKTLWLALLFNSHLSLKTFYHLLAHFETIENIYAASEIALKKIGLQPQQIESIKNPAREIAKKIANELKWEKENRQIIIFTDERYPALLKEIAVPPPVLYVEGNLAALQMPQIAIVGARKASAYGLHNAEIFAQTLATAGCVVTSGLALGIDAAAHHGAISAQAPTVAVMGRGLRQIYPAQHHQLAQSILAAGGALVSEFPVDTAPRPHHFPQRNRIISGMSSGVLVVEAALQSGTLITARLALEQNRDVYAIPGNIHQPLAAGCHWLLQDGAKLVTTANDILADLPLEPAVPASAISAHTVLEQFLPKSDEAVLVAIDYEMTPIDVIVSRTGLTLAAISSILLSLELDGFVKVCAGEYIRVNKKYRQADV